jgi:beta-lactamase superfamily II metal-dependent hydrolase
MLMSGDLDAAGEQALLARVARGTLVSDVVLVGRQASAIASSPQWIESTAPGLAVASGGIAQAQSRQEVLARWRRVARVIDTRREGGLQLRLGDRGVERVALARTARFPFHWRRPV